MDGEYERGKGYVGEGVKATSGGQPRTHESSNESFCRLVEAIEFAREERTRISRETRLQLPPSSPPLLLFALDIASTVPLASRDR